VIFYSIPPNLKTLKEIINHSNPKKITFVLKDNQLAKKELLQRASGVIKHIVLKKNGRTNYAEIAANLGITLETAEAAINYLDCMGFIEYEEVYDQLFLYKGKSKNLEAAKKYEIILDKLVGEMNSFRRFVRSTDLTFFQ
jgi:predicted transcriptional regulator